MTRRPLRAFERSGPAGDAGPGHRHPDGGRGGADIVVGR
jgi:hypothetical protein